tara:strand:+ start:105 stop:404 length:300 start_codon:yes stop_codon:yes gene_type:complete
MDSENTLLEFIRESSISMGDGTVVEYGSKEHINEFDRIISDLQAIKSTIRKGENRKFHRKEAHRIQDAIGAIRYLKRRATRDGIKKGLLDESCEPKKFG